MAPPTESRDNPGRAVIRPVSDRRSAIRFLIGQLRVRGRSTEIPAPSPDLWRSIAEEALRYRIGPFALRQITDGPFARQLPDDVRATLRDVYIRNGFRNGILVRETAAAARALAARDIPVLLLKGQHLANFEYADPALRSMADIDIMVPRPQLAEAESVFVEMGYGPDPRPDLDEHCAWSNQLAKLEKPGAEVVELHYAIERPTSPFRIDTAGLWTRAIESSLAGVTVWRLSTEDLILHLSLHLAYHHQFERAALKGITDLAVVVAKNEETIDWGALERRAMEWGAAPFAGCSLDLASRLLGAPVPAGLPERLGVEAAVAGAIEQTVLAPTIELPGSIAEQLRASGGWFGALAKSVFLPPSKMRELYDLPAGSLRIWPLYAVRVADLVRRRGALMATLLARTRDVRPTLQQSRDRDIIRQWVERHAPTRSGPGSGREGGH